MLRNYLAALIAAVTCSCPGLRAQYDGPENPPVVLHDLEPGPLEAPPSVALVSSAALISAVDRTGDHVFQCRRPSGCTVYRYNGGAWRPFQLRRGDLIGPKYDSLWRFPYRSGLWCLTCPTLHRPAD